MDTEKMEVSLPHDMHLFYLVGQKKPKKRQILFLVGVLQQVTSSKQPQASNLKEPVHCI